MAINVGDAVVELGLDTKDLDSGLSGVTGKLERATQKWGRQMKIAGGIMMGAVTAVGVASLKMAADFDEAFRKVNVMLRASSEETIKYKEQIRGIAEATGKSATEVTNAFYQIVSAGYRGADAIDILDRAVRASVGGFADATATTAALTKAMSIFQLEGVEGSSRALDTFFGIVDTGLLTFEELSNSFPRAASNAAGLGISIEETGATLGTLTKYLGSTEQAATATDAVLRLLISPSEALQALYKEWGVSSGPEAIAQFGGLTGVLKKLQEATGGEVTAIRELFASDEAMKGILPLLTVAYGEYNDAVMTITNSVGAADDAFTEAAGGIAFKWGVLQTKLQGVAIVIGEALIPALESIINIITPIIERVGAWSEKHPKLTVAILASVGAMGGLLLVAGPLLSVFNAISAILPRIVYFLSTQTVATIAQSVATGIAAAKQWLLNAAMSANPIGLIIMAIAGLVAAVIWLVKHWDKVTNFFKETWRKIKLFFLTGIEKILGALAKFIGWLPWLGDKVTEAHDKIAGMIDAEKIKQDSIDAQRSLRDFANEVRNSSDDIISDVERATKTAIDNAQSVADKEKQALEDRAKFYRDMHYERMDLIDEQMMAEIRAVDPVLAAKLEGYNEQLKGFRESDEERNRDIEEDRLNALKDELRDGKDLTGARKRELGDQIADIEDRWEEERLIEERNRLIAETDMGTYFEGQKTAVDDQLTNQIAAYNGDLEAFRQLNLDKLDEARQFVNDYNRIMKGLGTEASIKIIYPTVTAPTTPSPEHRGRLGVYDKGGLITEPTLLYGLKSLKPYAIAGKRGTEVVSPSGGTITNNFNIAELVVREEADVRRIARELRRLDSLRPRYG